MTQCARATRVWLLAGFRQIKWRQLVREATQIHAHRPPTHLTALKRELHLSYSCSVRKSSSHLQDKWRSQIGQCIVIKSQAPSSRPLLLRCPCRQRFSHSRTRFTELWVYQLSNDSATNIRGKPKAKEQLLRNDLTSFWKNAFQQVELVCVELL